MSDDDQIGPPQDNPFASLTPDQIAHYDRALQIADGVKLYRAAGGIGVAQQWAPYALELDKRGGLTMEEATNLSRYRMWKQGIQPPLGPREPDLTPDQIAARREQFMNASPQERGVMMDEDKAAIVRSQQGYFDALVQPKKQEPAPEEQPSGGQS